MTKPPIKELLMLRLLLLLSKPLGIIALTCLISFCTTSDEIEEIEEVVMDLPPVPDIDVVMEESLPEMEFELIEETTTPFTVTSPISFAFNSSSATSDTRLELKKTCDALKYQSNEIRESKRSL